MQQAMLLQGSYAYLSHKDQVLLVVKILVQPKDAVLIRVAAGIQKPN